MKSLISQLGKLLNQLNEEEAAAVQPNVLVGESEFSLTLDSTPGFILVLMEGAIHIGEAGKLADMSVDTIRFYQKLRNLSRKMVAVRQKDVIQRGNEPGSKATMFASLGALASVIAASSCCLPLLPFLFAAGSHI